MRAPVDERATLLAVPVALLLGWLLVSSGPGAFLAWLVDMPFHELGHAVASWMGARAALPLPFFTFWQEDQHFLVGLWVLGLASFAGFVAFQERRPFAVFLAALLGALTLVLWWGVDARTSAMWQILGGPLGPVVLPAILLASFHFPFPERVRWDFWRFLALPPAALAFVSASLLFSRASADPSLLPWGSALGDSSDGDLNRLVADYGWSGEELARLGRGFARGCWVAVLLGVAWAAGRDERARLHEGAPQREAPSPGEGAREGARLREGDPRRASTSRRDASARPRER